VRGVTWKKFENVVSFRGLLSFFLSPPEERVQREERDQEKIGKI
jgi:hypothetical protein